MTKLVVCLLVFGLFFTIQTVGHMNSDPAPGRSPGPPGIVAVPDTGHPHRTLARQLLTTHAVQLNGQDGLATTAEASSLMMLDDDEDDDDDVEEEEEKQEGEAVKGFLSHLPQTSIERQGVRRRKDVSYAGAPTQQAATTSDAASETQHNVDATKMNDERDEGVSGVEETKQNGGGHFNGDANYDDDAAATTTIAAEAAGERQHEQLDMLDRKQQQEEPLIDFGRNLRPMTNDKLIIDPSAEEQQQPPTTTTTAATTSPPSVASTTTLQVSNRLLQSTATATGCTDGLDEFLNDVTVVNELDDNETLNAANNEGTLRQRGFSMSLQLEHDIFDTSAAAMGINCGLVYKVRLTTTASTGSSAAPGYSYYTGDFFVQSYGVSSGRERGSFVSHTLGGSSGGGGGGGAVGNKLPISWLNALRRHSTGAASSVASSPPYAAPAGSSRNGMLNNWLPNDGSISASDERYATRRNDYNAAAADSSKRKWQQKDRPKNAAACPDNKWHGSVKSRTSSLSGGSVTDAVHLWLLNELCERNDTIEFRVYFRLKYGDNVTPTANDATDAAAAAQHMQVYRQTFRFRLNKDCQLMLREATAGTLDYTMLPLYSNECTVHFPSYEHQLKLSAAWQTPATQIAPAGILVELQRLNVPCNGGGHVRFNGRNALCGKLEELADTERAYHFDVRHRSAVTLHSQPMFSLSYKLVDYCYNVSTSNQSGEFYIRPSTRSTLECFFRIHLPYGNRVLLRLVTNNDTEVLHAPSVEANGFLSGGASAEESLYALYTALGESIDTQIINLTLSASSGALRYEQFQTNNGSAAKQEQQAKSAPNSSGLNMTPFGATANCDGIVVKVFEDDYSKWSHCVDAGERKVLAFIVESTGNTLSVHLFRADQKSRYNGQRPAAGPYSAASSRPNSNNNKNNSQNNNKQSASAALPAIYLSYQARPRPEVVSNCAFGWIAMQQFCVTAVADLQLPWHEAEQQCVALGGHLVSIRNEGQQQIVNELLLRSPGYQDQNAYWVGGSDNSYEGDFRWSDGLLFQYTNWFPGWSQHDQTMYNKQPNDDGLSSQDCIELRRFFRTPPGIQSTRSPLATNFMWNDRDCSAKNFLICEQAMSDDSFRRNWINDCNKTVSLTKEHPRASIWSPSFPRQYPDNANCFTTITAPAGYRIVIEFEELVIENEPGCTYDYLEITEPPLNGGEGSSQKHKTTPNATRNFRKRNSYELYGSDGDSGGGDDGNNDIITEPNDVTDNYLYNNNYNGPQSPAQQPFQHLNIFSHLYKAHTDYVIQTPDYPKGNPYAHGVANSGHIMPKRLCGDWSSKLKLLRHVSRGSYLGLHFVSDYSHHFGGYKAKTYMENRSHLLRAASECANERLKLYNGSCYLFISYPEVDWWTAQQVCRGMGAKLSSVSTADEHRFITSNIRNQIDYSPQLIYWLGAELEKNGQFEWTDDTKMSFQGWLPGQGQFDVMPSDATCLGLQWKMSPTPMLPSGLYWQSQKCNKVGGYVCKKPKESFGKYAFSNFTVTGSEGRLVSPAYPNTYPLNIDYWIHIKAPERTRIVVQFQKIDLESQDECLYDFVSIQNYELISHITLEPGTNPLPMAMLTSDSRLAFWDDSDTDGTLHYDDDARLQLQHRIPRSLGVGEDDELRTRQRRSASSNNFMAQSEFQINHKTTDGLKRQANEKRPTAANFHLTDKKTFSILDSQWRRRSRNMPPAQQMQQQTDGYVMAPKARGRHTPPAKPHENPKRRRRKKFRPEIANRREAKPKPALRRIRRNSPAQQQTAADHGVASDNAQSFLPYVRWCGQHDANMSKFDFVSSSNQAVLNFHSDYSVTGLGFAAIWKAIDVSGCPLRTLTSREGSVFSPNYPHFLLNNLNCAYVIQAPMGRRVWLEFTDYDLRADAVLAVDIGLGQFRPFRASQHLNEGIFVSVGEQLRVQFRTGQHPRGKGFQAIYHTVGQLERRERIIQLASNTTGHLFQLNYPNDMPENVDFTQHLVAPFGDNILLELHGVEFTDNGCPDNNILEIYDNYADNNGTKWQLCQYRSPPIEENPPTLDGDNPLSNEAESPYGYHDFDQESQRQQQYHNQQQQHHQQQRQPLEGQQHHQLLQQQQQQRRRHEEAPPPVYITSYLNTLHIRQRTSNAKFDANLNASIHMQWDNNYKMKLASGDKNVEACQPNPCQFNGKCVTSNGSNYCQCQGHYTGRFCGLTVCELEPCIFGKCVLTASSFKCQCQPGYMGTTCEQKQRPCADNPCEGRGICIERNGGYFCRCHAWWEGHKCERRMMHIPYKPLSERMLQEPFWLGLITVFVVLAVIGLVWCAKRHFPEKIEKLLAEEADRNRPPGSIHGHHHHTSLREQLQFTTAIPQGTGAAAQGGAPRSIFNRLGIRKPSLLSLSSPNPISGGGGGAAARTFSLDDLLRPPPRRSPSPRKKRNNSTPVKKNAAEKKQILQQLVSPAAAQTPTAKLSLGELISMTENRLRVANNDSESDVKETTFSENSGSLGSATVAHVIADPKLEKKVTFARLLNKVSAEMSSGSEVDIGQMAGTRNSSALSLPTDIQFRASSMPPSPCTNDIRSPHSTSSNQGSDSLSSSDMALTDFGLRSMQTSGSDIGGSTTSNHIAGLGLVPPSSFAAMSRGRFQASQRPKVSSADSILAMFRNFAAASASTTLSGPSTTTGNISLNGHTPYTTAFMPLPTSASASLTTGASVFVSPSNTPTVSSPQDDAPGDDESSTSSMHTPVSFSSGAPDSPVFYRQTTIEVPVLDVLNAHKSHSGSQSSSASSSSNNLLHPPTILLEIPSAGINNKCLSPIREMPTPIPSPALTPIMPRPNRSNSPIFQEDPLYGDFSDDDQRSDHSDTHLSEKLLELQKEQEANPLMLDSDVETTPTDTTTTSMADSNKPKTYQKLPLKRMSAISGGSLGGSMASALPPNILVPPIITIDVEPPTPEERAIRPRDLIIPTLTVEQPSPTKNRHPMIIFPGSPPPQRASIGETSFMFPNKQQQKRLLKQFEKPTSLEFPFVPPMITITSNMSELESDTEPMSPAPKTGSAGGLMPPNPVGMCYLSPFTMCTRADRTISESNLSSSGYSSMASPGPSRCGSSNPLCPNEMDEPGSGHSGGGALSLHVNLMNRRRSSALASCKENISNGKGNGSGSGTTASVSLAAANSEQLLQHRIRPRSDSETFSDDIVVESNDEGIGTDHVDEKLDDSRLNSSRFKELDVFMEEHVLIEVDEPVSVSSSLLALSGSATPSGSASLLMPSLGGGSTPASPNLQQMAQLQLPSIVIQIDGNEKGLSPVSSRSESPLSERAGIGRFSPHFYGRKDQLPFTDSDGLYDFPSSDGKGGTSAATYTHQRRSNSKKRERKSSKCSLSQSPTKQQLDVPAKEQGGAQQSASPTATSTPTPMSGTSAGAMSMHVCSKHCHSHHHPCPAALGVQTRKSPKRRQVNRLPVASSSSSSESLISPKELTVRQLPRRLNSPNREKRPRKQESLSEEEVADALLRRISPSLVKEEEPPKPKCKINRLRAIGNQIRFLRRLKKSIKTRERLASPSDSCPEENTDDNDSPQATSPLLQPTSPTKTRLGLCRQKRLPSDTYGITAAEMNTSNWKGMDRSLIGDDLNSD